MVAYSKFFFLSDEVILPDTADRAHQFLIDHFWPPFSARNAFAPRIRNFGTQRQHVPDSPAWRSFRSRPVYTAERRIPAQISEKMFAGHPADRQVRRKPAYRVKADYQNCREDELRPSLLRNFP